MKFSLIRSIAMTGGIALVAAALLTIAPAAEAAGTSYYVDCSQSTNGSGTEASPWNSIASVNSFGAFAAGDVIFFAQGTTCSGALTPTGSGTSSSPITLDSYVTTANHSRPVIDGGTDAIAALELNNQQYWTIQNLEIKGGAYREILVTGDAANTTLNGFRFNNLYVHDTSSYPATNSAWKSDAGGIILSPCNSTTTLNDIVIDNVAVHHTYAQGIQVGHDSDVPQLSTCTGPNYANSVTNVTIQNVTGDANAATAIAVYWSKNVTIQYSKFFDNGKNGVHGEGSWSYHCDGCTWQYNESFGNHIGDGGGFDMDGETTDSVVQYNYIHDNGGYCVADFAVGGIGHVDNASNTIRYNVCQNNATEARAYDYGQIFVSNFVDNGTGITGNQVEALSIYNNTIYGAPSYTGLPAISLMTEANVPLFSGTASFAKNNIVYATTPVIVGADNAGMTFDYNDYYYTGGTPQFAYDSSSNSTVNYTTFAAYQAGSGQDAHSVVADPLENLPSYHADGISPTAGTLRTGSPALGAGALISGNGGHDAFFGTVSSSTAPNIGAYNGAATTGAPAITGTHVIRNNYSHLAMGVNGSTTAGTFVAQYTPNGGTDQEWTLTAVGDSYKIVNVASGLALDDYQWQSQNLAPVDQWSYGGGTNQLWNVIPVAGGYRIVNVATGLSLDDTAFGTTSGSPICQWPFHGSTNEAWTIA